MSELRVRPLTSDSCPAPLRPRHLRVQLAVQGSGTSVARGLPRQMFEGSSRKRVIGSQFLVPALATPSGCGGCGGCARLEARLQQLLRKYKAAKHRYLQLRGAETQRTASEDGEQSGDGDCCGDTDGKGSRGGDGTLDAELAEALRRRCQAAEAERKGLQLELDALKRGYDELAERQRATAAELEATTAQAERCRAELGDARAKLEAQSAAMRDLESSIARQRDAGAITASSLQQSLQQARAEATQLRAQNAQLARQLEGLQAQCDRLQQAATQLEAALSESRHGAERSGAELMECRDRYKQATQRIASLEERMAGMLQVISKHSKERQRIMDSAFTTAIRLCVIAPTVTVEVDDLSVRIGPTVNEGQIRDVVAAELTERYNLIFKQESEDAGPNGEELDSWVSRMTRKLKARLEEQIASAIAA